MNLSFLYFFNKKKIEYQKKQSIISSLAPKILKDEKDIEKIQPYLDKLNETIDTKGINNIALTGGYGSGKSTIIGTFKELNPQYEFLNISLASFNKKKNDDDVLTSTEKKLQKEELERLLEVSILQQIFYHVKPDEIPESRFKRIINIPDWKIWIISISFILWVSSSVLLLKYDYLDKINPNNWNTKDSFDWFALFIFIIAFIGLGLFSKLIIKLFSNSKINKVNIKGELELGDNVNKSVFNEHLEEILYFFERTKYNVVLIEDLDRFDSTDIFTKLREINILLNNSKLINREINFVYAVGDDLFNDKKERVKFFEYIIPVVPFINSVNADEQLIKLIKDSGLNEDIFSKDFMSDITTFIDDIDMRLLTNIFHEFVIYRNILNPDIVSNKNDELFAIITYKNIDPEDFNLLGKKEGYLFNLINNKRTYIKEITKEIENKIDKLTKEIKSITNENISDLDELRRIYLYQILSKLPSNAIYFSQLDILEYIDEISFNKLIKKESIDYEYNNPYYNDRQTNSFNFNFSEIEKEVNSTYTYADRVGFIENKSNNKIEELKKEIDNLRIKLLAIDNYELKKIFADGLINIDEYLKDFSNIKLVKALLTEGYINENYNDYISLFHEGSIVKADKIFERNVKNRINSDFNYKLNNIENLVNKHFELKHFQREAILNFDLLDFLGNNYELYSDKYDSIIQLISNDKNISTDFIDEYIRNEDRPLEIFIIQLVKKWKNFWEYVYYSFGEEKKNNYFNLILKYVDISEIIKTQNIELLKQYIEAKVEIFTSIKAIVNREDYYNEFYTLIKRQIINYIKELDIKFKEIDTSGDSDTSLLDFVYNNNHYVINEENIIKILKKFNNCFDEKEFYESNYKAIIKSNCKPLIDYVNQNISTYIKDVYLNIDDNIFEEEEYLIELLNNENLSENLKKDIILKVYTKIKAESSIEDLDVLNQLLVNNKIEAKWENVTNAYKRFYDLTDELITFLNFEDVYLKLSKSKLNEEDKEFEEVLIKCNNISNKSYIQLLKSTFYYYNELNFENLEEEKVVNLIEKTLRLTKYNYDMLRESFCNNHISLIEKDFNKFIENLDDFETDDNDKIMILESENISIDNKFIYINKFEQNIIKENNELSKIIGTIILDKSESFELEFDTIKSIIKNLNTSEGKIKFINLNFDYLDNNQLISLLETIPNYNKLFEKGKPTYLKTDYNELLFRRLKSKNIIKNYYDDSWNSSKFRITTNE